MNGQQFQQSQAVPGDDSLRPIRKFSSFFSGPVQYQCVQTCYPNLPSQPQMLVELCNKICPFKPNVPECSKCPQIYSLNAPTPGEFSKKSMVTQPEAIVVEPESHAIMFTPEIVVAGYERKQCCYLDKCTTVPLETKCDPICYEPCDAACTGRCLVNPQCPHECDRVRKQQLKMRYRMWLAGKLNEIKQKYRELATACLLRTRLAFVGEVQNYYQAAKTVLGDVQVVPNQAALPASNMIQTQAFDQDADIEQQQLQPLQRANDSEEMAQK